MKVANQAYQSYINAKCIVRMQDVSRVKVRYDEAVVDMVLGKLQGEWGKGLVYPRLDRRLRQHASRSKTVSRLGACHTTVARSEPRNNQLSPTRPITGGEVKATELMGLGDRFTYGWTRLPGRPVDAMAPPPPSVIRVIDCRASACSDPFGITSTRGGPEIGRLADKHDIDEVHVDA